MKENIITVWVVTIILVITSLLLPTISTYAEEEEKSYGLYGIVGFRPPRHVGYAYFDEDNVLQTEQFKSSLPLTDDGQNYCCYGLTYYYNSMDKTTNIVCLSFYINKGTKTLSGWGTSKNLICKKGKVDLKDMAVALTGSSFFHKGSEVSTSSSAYTSDLMKQIQNYFNSGGENKGNLTITDGLVYDQNRDEWYNENIMYDLEIVKGLTVTIPDDLHDEKYILKWEPSQDLMSKEYFRNVEIEITQCLYGEVRNYAFESWKKFENIKYTHNSVYAYKKYWKGSVIGSNWYHNAIMETVGKPSGQMLTYLQHNDYTSDWLVRYKYKDDNNVIHYSSNYVYIQCKKDGTYTISVPEKDDLIDITPDTPTIETDDYTDDIIESIPDDDDVIDIWKSIKSLFNNLKEFPDYFSRIFNFLPEWIISLIAFSIGALITIALLKAIL